MGLNIMNIFAGLQKYASQFGVVDSRSFTPEEIAQCTSAKVVDSQYGQSVCFYMHSGCQHYIPVSRDSIVATGTVIDLTKAKILTLERDDETIHRIEI